MGEKVNAAKEIIPTHPFILTLEEVTADMQHKVGGKGLNLSILFQEGLPVPDAVCVTTDAFEHYQEEGQIDPKLLEELETIRQQFGNKVAVRSSATCEDGEELSMAGVFETVYVQKKEQTIEEALREVYDQGMSDDVIKYLRLQGIDPSQVKMGVIVQKLIEPELAGVVYTDVNKRDILVQYVAGFGDKLVDGKDSGASVIVDKDGNIKESFNLEDLPISQEVLASLAGSAVHIKRIFSDRPQDIEFACEDGRIYILQARPLTTELPETQLEQTPKNTLEMTKRKLKRIMEEEKRKFRLENPVLSDSNFSELLPRPKEMDIGIFAYIFTGDNGVPGAIQLGRKGMGYLLDDRSVGYMYFVGGKPYFSIAGDAHTFYIGFPETIDEYNDTLVAEYLNRAQINPEEGIYPEMGLYLQDPTYKDLQERFGDKADEYYAIYKRFVRQMDAYANSFLETYRFTRLPKTLSFIEQASEVELNSLNNEGLVEYVTGVLEHLRTGECVDFVKSARLGFYYSQKLQAFLMGEFNMSKEEAEIVFSRLNQGLDGSAITEANLTIAQSNSLDEALKIARDKIGHYSTGEMLEIRHPRLKDNENAFRTYVVGIYDKKEEYLDKFKQQRDARIQSQEELASRLDRGKKKEFLQMVNAAQTYMALRETVKYYFTKEYSLVRDGLELLEKRLGMAKGDIYSVYPRELTKLITDKERYKHIIHERQQAFENYSFLDVPPVIRESDIENLNSFRENDRSISEFIGKLLAQGDPIEKGVIVNIKDFETPEEVAKMLALYKKQGLPVILVAKQMNLSHDPLIMQADGLIIENAGLVSHGAQRARELGRGALGGIDIRQLTTGEMVIFNPITRRVNKI